MPKSPSGSSSANTQFATTSSRSAPSWADTPARQWRPDCAGRPDMKSATQTMIGVTVVTSAALLSAVVVFASLRLEVRGTGADEIELYSPPLEDTVAGLSTNVW